MKREELIKQCRFYKGEDKNPFDKDIRGIMWLAEYRYVEMYAKDNELLWPFCDDYRAHGLLDFSNDDGVPLQIKAMLFDRYSAFNEIADAESFKNFYINEYKKEA